MSAGARQIMPTYGTAVWKTVRRGDYGKLQMSIKQGCGSISPHIPGHNVSSGVKKQARKSEEEQRQTLIIALAQTVV